MCELGALVILCDPVSLLLHSLLLLGVLTHVALASSFFASAAPSPPLPLPISPVSAHLRFPFQHFLCLCGSKCNSLNGSILQQKLQNKCCQLSCCCRPLPTTATPQVLLPALLQLFLLIPSALFSRGLQQQRPPSSSTSTT